MDADKQLDKMFDPIPSWRRGKVTCIVNRGRALDPILGFLSLLDEILN